MLPNSQQTGRFLNLISWKYQVQNNKNTAIHIAEILVLQLANHWLGPILGNIFLLFCRLWAYIVAIDFDPVIKYKNICCVTYIIEALPKQQ